ncbi:hypothetical protein EVAR_63472_1 [Eumeta japonica]|uniref:Uncharacterized protein n=1 Tax=Eumeta variegata TaxID=151549 RepID=A0A4C1Y9D3_EUMVA|nr:hypothetical protein EVAR_63472_1 [Eumeta japonica]
MKVESMRWVCVCVGVSLKDRCRDSDVRKRCGLKDVGTRVEVDKDRPRKSYGYEIGDILEKPKKQQEPTSLRENIDGWQRETSHGYLPLVDTTEQVARASD